MSRRPILDRPFIDRALGRKPKLSEADIQRACTDLLIADGWRAIRTDPVSDRRRGKGFGEIGMPDYLYIRYQRSAFPTFPQVGAEVLFVEYKAPGKCPSRHQEAWGDKERRRGALVIWTDSIEKFREWYADSGLSRAVR